MIRLINLPLFGNIFDNTYNQVCRSFLKPGFENVMMVNRFKHLNNSFIRCDNRLRIARWQEHPVRHTKRIVFWRVVKDIQPEYQPKKVRY